MKRRSPCLLLLLFLLVTASCSPTGPSPARFYGTWEGTLAADIGALELAVNEVAVRVRLDGTLHGDGEVVPGGIWAGASPPRLVMAFEGAVQPNGTASGRIVWEDEGFYQWYGSGSTRFKGLLSPLGRGHLEWQDRFPFSHQGPVWIHVQQTAR